MKALEDITGTYDSFQMIRRQFGIWLYSRNIVTSYHLDKIASEYFNQSIIKIALTKSIDPADRQFKDQLG